MDSHIIGFAFYDGFYADVENRHVSRDRKPLDDPLTKLEFAFLEFFLSQPHKLIKREDVSSFDKVTRTGRPADHYISILNRKLGLKPGEIFVVKRGVGFELMTNVRPVYRRDREKGVEILRVSEFNFNTHTIDAMRSSLEQSLKVLELNPHGLPDAYVRVAYNYLNLGTTGYAVELADKVIPEARRMALKALDYQSTAARAQGLLGLISLIYDYDWKQAEKHLFLSLKMDPDQPDTLLSYAHFLVTNGKFADAFVAIEKGARMKPEDRIIYATWGWIHTLAGDTEEGIRLGEETLSFHPGFPPAHVILGWAYESAGQYELASTQYELALNVEYSPPALASLGHVYGKTGQRNKALETLAELEALHRRGIIKYVPAYCRALVYAGLQEIDRCLDELERAYDERCDWLMHLVLEKRWAPVKQTPRFTDLVAKVGIPFLNPSQRSKIGDEAPF